MGEDMRESPTWGGPACVADSAHSTSSSTKFRLKLRTPAHDGAPGASSRCSRKRVSGDLRSRSLPSTYMPYLAPGKSRKKRSLGTRELRRESSPKGSRDSSTRIMRHLSTTMVAGGLVRARWSSLCMSDIWYFRV